MRSLSIQKNKHILPEVILDAQQGSFRITGDILVHPDEYQMVLQPFFQKIFNWLQEYTDKPNTTTRFEFFLDRLRPQVGDYLEMLILKLKQIPNITIAWKYYEEYDDSREYGEELSQQLSVDFLFETVD